jgi:gamma-glutamyltranspeptidase
MVRDVREGLTKRGEILREEGSYSAVTAIALGTGKNRGELWAAPDPRKSGFAATR